MLKGIKASLYAAASASTLALALTAPSGAIPYRDDIGDQGAQNFAAQWDGVIQIFMWNRTSGNISFNCTGSMINARTVLSAAHCFNANPNSVYGTAGPLTPIIAYGPDTFQALFNWIDTGNQFIDDRNGLSFALNVMTPAAGTFGGEPFPAADVALLTTLDPLITVPTYGMLFSPIPADVLNAGVHVNMIGYGSYGPGSGPTIGINGRRRAGENMLGFLGSQNNFLQGLTGNPNLVSSNPNQNQMMYWIDFDQPDRTGLCVRAPASGFNNSIVCSDYAGGGVAIDADTAILPGPSIDLFPGDALPNEAGTAGGDSGGPLMAMNIFNNPLILGVLSGGFIEGFFHTAGQQHGKLSYYNPLFAYAGWIAENNPYKYVTNTGGGDWFDETIWVQAMDPNYFIYQDGQIVNGIPDGPDLGTNPGNPWGTVFDTDLAALLAGSGSAGEVAEPNLATDFVANGVVANVDGSIRPVPSGGQAGVTSGSAATTAEGFELVSGGDAASQNAGPGSAGFVPRNFYGVQASAAPRFYDVTLAANGNVTLSGALVEIDRLTLAGAGAELTIAASANMWSLISTELLAGTLTVNGGLVTREVVNWGGLVRGTGGLNLFDPNYLFRNGQSVAGAFFNVGGIINPGLASQGGLLINGDFIQSSGGGFLVDWNETTNSLLFVDGNVSLNGGIMVNPTGGYVPAFGDRRTVLVHSGERVGQFSAGMDLPGVLFLSPIYSAGQVEVLIQAEAFTNFANFTNPAQEALGGRLDRLRGSPPPAGLAPLYQVIDLLPNGPLEAAFENLVPHESFQLRRSVASHAETFGSALRSRALTGPGGSAGSSAGQAMFGLLGSEMGAGMSGESLAAAARQADAGGSPEVRNLGNGFEAFVVGGLVDGSAPTTASSPDASTEGGFAMAGFDYGGQYGWRVGAALGFASSESDQVLPAGGQASSRLETAQITGYALYRGDALHTIVSLSLADHTLRGRRDAVLGGVSLPVSGTLDASSWDFTAQIGYTFEDNGLRITPLASVTASSIGYDSAQVTGSPAAFNLTANRDSYTTGRFGADIGYTLIAGGFTLEPTAYVGNANRLDRARETLVGDFAGAPTATRVVLGSGLAPEKEWFEIAVGARAHLRNGISLSLAYETREGDDRVRNMDVFMLGLRTQF